MKQKYFFIALLTGGLILGMSLPPAQACSGEKQEGEKASLKDKFLKQAHFALKESEALGLSEDQVEKIKALKIQTKKDLIMKKAEIETIAIDIKAETWKESINVEAVNKLIDKKYEIKKAKTKAIIKAYAALKDTLTADQKEKLKKLYCEKCSQSKGSICPLGKKKTSKGSGYFSPAAAQKAASRS